MFRFLDQKTRPSPLTFLSHVLQACTQHSQRILHTREGSRRGTGNDTLIRHSSDLAIFIEISSDFSSELGIGKIQLSLKHVRSQARVGVLYSERSDYCLVERHLVLKRSTRSYFSERNSVSFPERYSV